MWKAPKLIDRSKQYDTADALDICVKTGTAKFDETVELHVKLGVDGRHADQQVRGAIVLPNGTGKMCVCWLSASPRRKRTPRLPALIMWAAMEMVQKIQSENWMDFDVLITTPDMMGLVGRLGRLLGPRGLMPNPKAGTVTPDIAKAVSEAKAGKIEYRLDKTNIIHCPIGKVSFGVEKLQENFDTLMDAIREGQALCGNKGQYVRSCVVSATMGPGVKINPAKFI